MKQMIGRKSFRIWLVMGTWILVAHVLVPNAVFPQNPDEPKFPNTLTPHETIVDEKDKDKPGPTAPLMTCGKCPEGYAKTAVAVPRQGLEIGANFNTAVGCEKFFEDKDSVAVECRPIGLHDQMAVCGSCPQGYREVGKTYLPALCGNEDNGLRTQCQVPNMQSGLPDPTQGGRRCPPDCVGNLPTPGQGSNPPHPPKVPSIEIRKIRPEESP